MLSALLTLQYARCSPHEKDKGCAFNSTGLQSTSAGIVGTQNARNQFAAVDIKHIYVNDYGEEDTKKQLRVTLSKGEDKWIYFWTSFNREANPRTFYIRFDGEQVLASIASYSVFYNSITVTTSRKWSCLHWSLNKGQYGYGDFSSYSNYRRSSGFEFYTDKVDIRVLPDNIPLGPSKDLECFDKQFPSLKTATKNRLRVNITKMFYKKIGISKWCCKDVKEESTVIDLTEGQPKIISLKYVSITDKIGASKELKRRFRDENPRNLTMMFSNGILYAGMAKLKETAYHTGKQWFYDSSWECVNITIATKGRSVDTASRLDFFSYYSNAGPVTTIQRRTDYVLLDVQSSHAELLSSSVTVFMIGLIAGLRNTLNM